MHRERQIILAGHLSSLRWHAKCLAGNFSQAFEFHRLPSIASSQDARKVLLGRPRQEGIAIIGSSKTPQGQFQTNLPKSHSQAIQTLFLLNLGLH